MRNDHLFLRSFAWACMLTALLWQETGSTVLDSMAVEKASAVASRRNAGADTNPSSAPVAVEFLVSGKPFRGQGAGQCKHEPNATIYNAPASLWTVEFSDGTEGVKHVTLSVWQPKSNSQSQMSLALDTRAGSHRIATVKGGQLVGVGMVNFRSEKSGGRFDIKGKDATGITIEGSITCPSFGNIIAEGG